MNLTLKNIPRSLHRRLKAQAKRHNRSLNWEVLLCLEAALSPHSEKTSLATPPAAASVGRIMEPWTSRSDMLDNFLDSRS